jgi:DNA-binding XRE family transcriptional regulator
MIMSKLKVKTKSAGVKFDDIKAQLMENAEFKDEYIKLQPRYELISQIIEARKSMDMTQGKLAKLAETRKSTISRLESGFYNPSLDFLIKIAKNLDKEVHIDFC